MFQLHLIAGRTNETLTSSLRMRANMAKNEEEIDKILDSFSKEVHFGAEDQNYLWVKISNKVKQNQNLDSQQTTVKYTTVFLLWLFVTDHEDFWILK